MQSGAYRMHRVVDDLFSFLNRRLVGYAMSDYQFTQNIIIYETINYKVRDSVVGARSICSSISCDGSRTLV